LSFARKMSLRVKLLNALMVIRVLCRQAPGVTFRIPNENYLKNHD
jgi:hypothetical protein